jgi:hypothetical protein
MTVREFDPTVSPQDLERRDREREDWVSFRLAWQRTLHVETCTPESLFPVAKNRPDVFDRVRQTYVEIKRAKERESPQ